jgi:hypothetical protein
MASPEPGSGRARKSHRRLLGVDSHGTAPALLRFGREGTTMETILIIVVLLFLFGGGGYYWNSRRG